MEPFEYIMVYSNSRIWGKEHFTCSVCVYIVCVYTEDCMCLYVCIFPSYVFKTSWRLGHSVEKEGEFKF